MRRRHIWLILRSRLSRTCYLSGAERTESVRLPGPRKDSQNLALFLFRLAGRTVAASLNEEVLLDLQQRLHRFVVVFGNLDECIVAQLLQIVFVGFGRLFAGHRQTNVVLIKGRSVTARGAYI